MWCSLSSEAIGRIFDADWWLKEAFGGCINVQPAEPSTLRIDASHSSLGNIDRLPPEIQLLIIEQLDFRALTRLMRASKKGKVMVECLFAFIEMMEHAPGVLAALGKTNLISHHSAASLRQVLRSKKCASCLEFGQLLFLPTCERICPKCLSCNDAFRMTTPGLAKECFSLSDEQLSTIPIMQVIPGAYGFWDGDEDHKWHSARRLVSAKQVKQLGLKIHGSEEALAALEPAPPLPVDTSQMLTGDPPRETDEAKSYSKRRRRHEFIQKIHSLQLEPPGRPVTFEEMESVYTSADSFRGTAACKIPVLSSSGPDYGHSCSSCYTLAKEFDEFPDPMKRVPDELKGLSEDEVWSHYTRACDIIHTGPEFVEHLKHCPGVPLLLDTIGTVCMDRASRPPGTRYVPRFSEASGSPYLSYLTDTVCSRRATHVLNFQY